MSTSIENDAKSKCGQQSSVSFIMLNNVSETLFNMMKLSDDCCPDFDFASSFITDKNIKNRNYAVEWMKQVSAYYYDTSTTDSYYFPFVVAASV